MKVISHKDAKAAGLKRYFTGKPCKRGHVAERFVSSADCTECNLERLRARKKTNPEKVRAWRRAQYKANADKERALIRAWQKANPDKHNARQARRRARKLEATPIWACKEAIDVIYALAQSQKKHVDHIIPLKSPLVCGLHVHNNMQLLPPAENMSKGNRYDG
jgi:hypothetical protein